VNRQGATDRLKTYWGIDQGDRAALCEIVGREFDGPIDLVIDDASHVYGPTRASFETLFPYLRQGGLYIIEDWQWSYSEHPPASLADEQPVAALVHELLDAVGRRGTDAAQASREKLPVKSVTVVPHFAAVERGVDAAVLAKPTA
jgi:hypothetical protein